MENITVENYDLEEVTSRGIIYWPVWEKEVSRFATTYEKTEECFFIEGEVIIETGGGSVKIKPGDFVTFSKGLKCVWDIRKKVKKHYSFLDYPE